MVGTHACSPECLFNTSRVMKGSWTRSRLFGFTLWGSASPCDDRILPQRGWPAFPIGAEAGLWGKIGRRSANNSKIMQMEANIFLFKQIKGLGMRAAMGES